MTVLWFPRLLLLVPQLQRSSSLEAELRNTQTELASTKRELVRWRV